MYLVYAPKSHLRERIVQLLQGRFDLALARSWEELEELASRATCTIIAIERFENWLDLEKLLIFRQRHRVRPVIIVTHGDAHNIRSLQNIPINATIFLSELDHKLTDAIRYHCSVHFLRRVAELFKNDVRLPSQLREALVYLLLTDHPPPSIDELARIVGCDRTTLNRQLGRITGFNGACTMKGIVDWIVLLRAVLRKTPKESWSEIAGKFGHSGSVSAGLSPRHGYAWA